MADPKVQNQNAVVFITKTGLQFFGSSSKSIPAYSFDEKLVHDLDVVDAANLQAQIQAFIDQNKLPPSPVIFVFSEPTCFYQDLKGTDDAKLRALMSEFVNVVPFETILTKVYKTKDAARVVSINERLYREIAQAFEAKGFVSLGVAPSLVLESRQAMATALDANIGRAILANIETIREQGFLAPEEKAEGGVSEERTIEKPAVEKSFKITKNVVILGVVMVVLGVVLVVLILSSR
ncbi:hypothetical protein HYT59_00275 [Candidatus Woesebacteria bacterium]|nr:hypothetical protein [Candidatus Woesebacteria bacterium]